MSGHESGMCYQHRGSARGSEAELTYDRAIEKYHPLSVKLVDDEGNKLLKLILDKDIIPIPDTEVAHIRMVYKKLHRAWELYELFNVNKDSPAELWIKNQKRFVKIPKDVLLSHLIKFFKNGWNVDWERDLPVMVEGKEYRSSDVYIDSSFDILNPQGQVAFQGWWNPFLCKSKATEKDPKYYFHFKTCQSYSLRDLVDANASSRVNVTLKRKGPLVGCIQVPSEAVALEVSKEFEKRYEFCLDVSRTNGDKVCPLTMEEWENPYICSVNGRSYSYEALSKAIESTLLEGNPLRLEDTSLLPEMLSSLKFYPNESLGGKGDVLKFDVSMVKVPKFDESKVTKEDVPEVSNFLRDMPAASEWDYKGLWRVYAHERGYEEKWMDVGVSIRNVRISNQYFPPPKAHPKCHSGHISFVNVLFEGCTIDLTSCWCGLDIKASHFRRCTFIKGTSQIHAARIAVSKAENCVDIVKK